MIASIVNAYQMDGLRADGYMVRFARLNMLSVHMTAILLLCWIMEVFFLLAYFHPGTLRTLSILGFWLAYLGILLQV